MLSRSSGGNSASDSNRSSQAGGLPWLKIEHLSSEKRILSILKARGEKDRWKNPSVVMQVRYDGKLFLWQPNAKNPNYDLLIDILGQDESKWPGNDVMIFLEEDELTTRLFPRVSKAEVKRGK